MPGVDNKILIRAKNGQHAKVLSHGNTKTGLPWQVQTRRQTNAKVQ